MHPAQLAGQLWCAALRKAHVSMTPIRQRQVTPRLLLGAALLGIVLYLSGLSATLQLSDAHLPGVLLIPALPTPLYIIMAAVALGGVGMILLASLRQRRRRASL